MCEQEECKALCKGYIGSDKSNRKEGMKLGDLLLIKVLIIQIL